jgi:hypothetical protein
VVQHMRCNPLSRKRGAILSRSCRMFLQDPGNAIASQRLTVARTIEWGYLSVSPHSVLVIANSAPSP